MNLCTHTTDANDFIATMVCVILGYLTNNIRSLNARAR
jgi:hypothetical protein